jgi:hypothetical protein
MLWLRGGAGRKPRLLCAPPGSIPGAGPRSCLSISFCSCTTLTAERISFEGSVFIDLAYPLGYRVR